ncbi:MAG TPA: hypothetical protein PLE28_01455 [bacterium]|nr:hypothetical protein [bacterium]
MFAFAQNAETKPSKSLGDFQIEIKKFYLNVSIENQSIVKDLILRPNDDYKDMYLSGNWGTIKDKISFYNDIKTQTVAFVFVARVVNIGGVYKLYEEGKDVGALLKSDLFSDVKTKKILCQAEFKNSAGQTIKQNLEINFEKNSKENGNEVFAKAIISDENLGLNVVSLKVNTEDMLFKFSLKNEEFGINMVIDPNKPAKEVKALAGKSIPDGVYTFICRMGLPNGIAKEEKIEAFVAGNEISISPNSFNPLVFTNGDYGIANFKKGISLVKVINSRSTAITVFIPADYASVANRNIESSIQTEAFSKQGSGWKSYVVPAGGSIKMKLKISSFPIIIYDLNRKTSEIIQVGLVSKNFQILTLGWGDSFSLK